MIKVSILTYFLCLSFHYVTSNQQFGKFKINVPDGLFIFHENSLNKICSLIPKLYKTKLKKELQSFATVWPQLTSTLSEIYANEDQYQANESENDYSEPEYEGKVLKSFKCKLEEQQPCTSCAKCVYKIICTKWCGAGNVAENDNDFGVERDTDKCCQEHDYCPDIIDGYQTKYNLTNPNFYTRLNCDCDQRFYECLKSVDTMSSKQIGQIYFTGLGTQCFKEYFPIAGCNKYTYFPKPKCLSYELDETQEKEYQWFDLPNF